MKKSGDDPVVELKKALYGHTQAGFLWEAEARKQLLEMGFTNWSDVSSAWYCMYSDDAKRMTCMLLLYVDDFLIAGDRHVVATVVSKMKKIWELKGGDIHPVNEAPILGTTFTQTFSQNHDIAHVIVDQRKYAAHTVDEFLQTTGVERSSLKGKADVPAVDWEQNITISKENKEEEIPFVPGVFAKHAPKLNGILMWLARTGWPQITVAVQELARNVCSWTALVDKQARRVMTYIVAHMATGFLMLRVSPLDRKQNKLKLLVFSDADHAGNISTRKSVSGAAIFLAGPNGTWSMLDWISRTQRTISLSTAEAELLAAQLALRECLTILILLDLFKIEVEVELLVDSAAALSVLLTGISSKLRYAAKSQGLCAAWCAQVLKDFAIKAKKVATDHNVADLFTKAVSSFTFKNLLHLCGWCTPEQASMHRCVGMHGAPAFDESCRCLNFVQKEGDLCLACSSTSGCRCFNGTTQWDARVDKEPEKIPLDVDKPI